MTDEAARELLAHEAERRLDADVIQQHREQCDIVEERVRKLRAMLATLSREL
jgi:hypothetical protein